MKITILPLIGVVMSLLIVACAKNTRADVEVYSNDFETNNLNNISNGVISTFNGSKVLGNYNNEMFDIKLTDLPVHDLVEVSFDLYIHDSWEGVQTSSDETTGPDIWQLLVDGKLYINTTFANFDCIPGNFCPPQSYPADYPNQSNNPKSGASRTDLPGFCSEVNKANGTTLYKISKRISHSSNVLTIRCLDMLKQKNVSDAKCDESWSIDNVKIKAISLN